MLAALLVFQDIRIVMRYQDDRCEIITVARVTTWNYGSLTGHLTGKRYADNTGPDYSYTSAGRLLTRTWARGIVTTYTNNAAGELLGIAYSDSTPGVSFTYDRRGRRTVVTTGTNTASYTSNEAGQLLTETFPLAGVTVTNTYDALSRREWLLVGTAGPAVRFEYDGASRLQAVSAGTLSASYAYTPHLPGLVSNVTFAAGGTNRLQTTKSYNPLNRLLAVDNVILSGAKNLSHSYAYNAANQRTERTDEDGSYWQYGYDALGQVTNAVRRWSANAPVSGQDYRYTFDDIGNRKTAQNGGSSSTSTYSANSLNQYESRTVAGVVDVTGLATNAATVTVNDIRATRHGDYFHAQVPVANSVAPVYTNLITVGVLKNAGSNQLDIVATKTGSVFLAQSPEQFTHDADGNVTSDGRWRYTWDAENRLIGMETLTNLPASVPRQKLEFSYDASFRRSRKQVFAWDTDHWSQVADLRSAYDGWNLVAEIDATNAVIRSYVWGLDVSGSPTGAGGIGGLLWQTDHLSSSASICGYDGNGNLTTLIGTATGAITATYEYGPFGETIRATGSAALANPFRFSTKYTDSETGLVMYPYRPYAPGLGRWLCADPLGEIGGLNLYGFVLNDPVSFHDPLGLELGDWWDARSYWNSGFLIGVGVGGKNIGLATWGLVRSPYDLMNTVGTMAGTLSTDQGRLEAVQLWRLLQMFRTRFVDDPCFREAMLKQFGHGAVEYLSNEDNLSRIFAEIGVAAATAGIGEAAAAGKFGPLIARLQNLMRLESASGAKRELIVVGEGMDRVEEMARRLRVDGLNVRTYAAPNLNRSLNPNLYGSRRSLDANWHWIDYWARKKQVDVLDIGLQPGRFNPSPYYQMEYRNFLRWEDLGQIRPVIRIDPGF